MLTRVRTTNKKVESMDEKIEKIRKLYEFRVSALALAVRQDKEVKVGSQDE